MTVKLLVLLLVAAFVAYRLLPRRRLPWMVPLMLVAVVLAVRTIAYVTGD